MRLNSFTIPPSSASQMRITPDWAAGRTRLPSGLNTAVKRLSFSREEYSRLFLSLRTITESILLGSPAACSPRAARAIDQIRAVPSADAVTTRLPSGLKLARNTDCSCLARQHHQEPAVLRRELARSSPEAVTMREPSRLKVAFHIVLVWSWPSSERGEASFLDRQTCLTGFAGRDDLGAVWAELGASDDAFRLMGGDLAFRLAVAISETRLAVSPGGHDLLPVGTEHGGENLCIGWSAESRVRDPGSLSFQRGLRP